MESYEKKLLNAIIEAGVIDEINPIVPSFFVENLRLQYGNGGYVLYYISVNNGYFPIRFAPEYIVGGNKNFI